MSEFAKIVIQAGVSLVVLGLVLAALAKLPGAGKLPGDIIIRKQNFTFYFPWVTCILLSLVISLLMQFFSKK